MITQMRAYNLQDVAELLIEKLFSEEQAAPEQEKHNSNIKWKAENLEPLVHHSIVLISTYPFIVTAQDAWSQIAVRGMEAMDPTFIPPGQKSKSDPFGQRGYAGAIWWKAVMIENAGWMAIGNVGSAVLA
jgi:hypothetical protein